ncbi:MAG: FMN-binding negative transcriptional regulator [Chloroflexi bacterium]|nr:FMN-binding negative transcriptional regulator [Chloroflexota bacterium]
MYPSPRYSTSDAAAEAFVAGQRHGTLIAVDADGFPQVSLLPFLKTGALIELHCVQADPTFAAVQANPRATFLVSDFLAFSPHDWVDARDAGRATLHFQAVAYECEATTSTEPADVAAALARLLASYEPNTSYEPLEDGQFYGGRLRRLAALRLRVVRTHAKFKAGPAPPPADVRQRVIDGLRGRGLPGDARAADVIERQATPMGGIGTEA